MLYKCGSSCFSVGGIFWKRAGKSPLIKTGNLELLYYFYDSFYSGLLAIVTEAELRSYWHKSGKLVVPCRAFFLIPPACWFVDFGFFVWFVCFVLMTSMSSETYNFPLMTNENFF